MFTAVFAAFPLLPVPGVNFTLNLQINVLSSYVSESQIQKHTDVQENFHTNYCEKHTITSQLTMNIIW
jgi:hypothetical protein